MSKLLRKIINNLSSSLSLLLLLTLTLVACYPTHGIEDGEQLYVGQKPVIYNANEASGDVEDVKIELEAALATAPNGAILSSPYHRYPFSTSYLLWDWTHNSQKGIGRWINQKMGTMPVLMSDVNPLLRTTVATNTLAANGFFRGSADYEEITLRNPKKGKIQYKVDFGPLFRIDSLQYTNYPAPMQALIDSTRQESLLSRGTGFSVSVLDKERQRLASLFRNQGYYYYQSGSASYLADTLQNPLHVQLRLQYNDSVSSPASRQWKIGRTHIYVRRNGERTTNDSIVRRKRTIHFNGKRSPVRTKVFTSDLLLRKGMLYSDDLYKKSLERLSRFDVFSSMDLTLTPADTTDGCNVLDVNFDCTLDKLWNLSLEGKLTGKTSSRIGPGVELTLTRRNPFRYADQLSFNLYGSYEWQFGGNAASSQGVHNSYEYGYGITYDIPILLVPKFISRYLRLDPSTRLKLSNAVVNRGEYFNRHILSGEVSYTYHPNRFQEHTFSPLSLSYSYMNKSSAEFDSIMWSNTYLATIMQNQFLPQIKYTYRYASEGYHRHPMTWTFSLAESGNLISLGYLCAKRGWNEYNKQLFSNPYAQFIKGETDFSKKWMLDTNSSVVAHVNLGIIWAYGNTYYAPYSEQFYVGGANSIRAFTARGIGPGDARFEDSQTAYISQVGDIKLVANLEYRPHFFGNLYGAVFLDMGNVWLMPHKYDETVGEITQELHFKNFFKDLALGTGIGIRYDLDFFVIRLDWGIGLHLPFDTGKSGYFNINKFKDAQTLHLAIGYPF